MSELLLVLEIAGAIAALIHQSIALMPKRSNQINVRLDNELKAKFEATCEQVRIEPATVIRACIEAFVEEVQEKGEIRMPLAIVPKSSVKKNEPETSSTAGPARGGPIRYLASTAPRDRLKGTDGPTAKKPTR